jgi:hypothetical protein
MEGMLNVRSGCVFVSDHNESWLLLWPEGYTAQLADGRLDVLDESGDIVGREGGRLRVGGGESTQSRSAAKPRPSARHPS